MLIFRSSRSQMFFKIGVPKNFAIFTGKHLFWPLQAFFYRTPAVADSRLSWQQIFFFSWIWYLLQTVRNGFCSELLWKHELKRQRQPLKLCCKNGILRKFMSFTGKHLCWSLFLIELQTFRPSALLRRGSNTDVFVEFTKILRTPNLKNICESLQASFPWTAFFNNLHFLAQSNTYALVFVS